MQAAGARDMRQATARGVTAASDEDNNIELGTGMAWKRKTLSCSLPVTFPHTFCHSFPRCRGAAAREQAAQAWQQEP